MVATSSRIRAGDAKDARLTMRTLLVESVEFVKRAIEREKRAASEQ